MPTDPARVRRTDPGDPAKCPVWQLHLVYSDDDTKLDEDLAALLFLGLRFAAGLGLSASVFATLVLGRTVSVCTGGHSCSSWSVVFNLL